MAHRIVFWEAIPLITVIIFGFFGDTFITSKWAWLITVIILGLCAIEAAVENANVEPEPDQKKIPMALHILGWIFTLPMVMFIIFTIMSVTSNIHIVLYVLMIAVSLLFIAFICLYAKHIWSCIKAFEILEPEEEVDED